MLRNKLFATFADSGTLFLVFLVMIIVQGAFFFHLDLPSLPIWFWIMIGAVNAGFLIVASVHATLVRRYGHMTHLSNVPQPSLFEIALSRSLDLSAFFLATFGGYTGRMWLLFPALFILYRVRKYP